MYERIYDPGMGYYRPRGALVLCTIPSQSAIGQWGWGFHTVRGGIDPGDRLFRPRFVGVVDVWNDVETGDGALFSPGAAGPGRSPEGKLPPRTPRTLFGRGRARGGTWPMALGLGKRWIETHLPIIILRSTV